MLQSTTVIDLDQSSRLKQMRTGEGFQTSVFIWCSGPPGEPDAGNFLTIWTRTKLLFNWHSEALFTFNHHDFKMHFFLLAAGNKARKALWPLLRFGYSYLIALCQSMANTDTGFGIKSACCLHVLPLSALFLIQMLWLPLTVHRHES